MISILVLIAGSMLLAPASQGQPDQSFQEAISNYLARAPLRTVYQYTLTAGEFHQDTSGTLILIGPSRFRLELWDKVYGSDGSSLYLHDRNTRQTVIDSLRWTAVNLWVRLLQGELPSGTTTTSVDLSPEGLVRWELEHENPGWFGVVKVDTSTWSVREIRLREEQGWEHLVRLDVPEPWNHTNLDSFMTLEDLPGIRLDLR